MGVREGQPFLSGWRLTAARGLALTVVVVTMALVFAFREQAAALRGYGYAGIFLISVIANSTIILPVPGVALTFTLGAVFHPIGVALAAGAGATIGELTGYLAGFSGQGLIKESRYYAMVEGWMGRFGGWIVLALAFVPNPLFDVAGAVAGAMRMPVFKFMLWAFVGKTMKMLAFAYAGAASIDSLLL
jgi:membrane protein YqaA with SNARE-associated domain